MLSETGAGWLVAHQGALPEGFFPGAGSRVGADSAEGAAANGDRAEGSDDVGEEAG